MSKKDKILKSLELQEAEEGLTADVQNIRTLLSVCTDGFVFQALVYQKYIKGDGGYPTYRNNRYYMQETFKALIKADWKLT